LSWRDLPKPPAPDGLPDWFEAGIGPLVSTLRDAEADAVVWNWSPGPQVGSFWVRRMAQETTVHRWDAESAHGVQRPIPTDLAVDGIDEIIRVGLAADVIENKEATLGGTLHLHATDADCERMVEVEGGQVRVTDEHGKGDAAVRGTASDLLLFLWGRTPAAPLEVFGDQAVVDNWPKVTDL